MIINASQEHESSMGLTYTTLLINGEVAHRSITASDAEPPSIFEQLGGYGAARRILKLSTLDIEARES